MSLIEKKLNSKQQLFADFNIELRNAEEAALKAGYSTTYARGQSYMWLANVGIKMYIEKRMEELKSERVADQQEQTLRGMGEGYQEIDDIDVSTRDELKPRNC